METFLQIVAKDIYSKLGNNLSRTVIVFPNKRASLFFNEYLVEQSSSPIWSPAYLSITELFQRSAKLKLGDTLQLVCELYKVYHEEMQNDETLDDFYPWGELMISDFDDIDKNMVDAEKLFVNLQSLKNILDDHDFLDKEQEEAIRQFFDNFSIERHTQLKEKFISIWDKLGIIYKRFQANLKAQDIAYEGMLYRDTLKRIDTNSLPYEKYIFVGFNVLNRIEFNLFKMLQDAEKALFYWDYDIAYTQTEGYKHEAGIFINRNLKMFPSQLSEEYFDNLRKPKKVSFISSSTENAQARFLPQWVRETLSSNEKENAVVLCNEALLLPVLHSVSAQVEDINITMGFPLAQTPVYSFINALIELQTTGYQQDTGRYKYASVQTILKHPYTRMMSDKAERLERELAGKNRFFPLPSELKLDEFLSLIFTPCGNTQDICRCIVDLLKEISALYRRRSDDNEVPLPEEENIAAHDVYDQLYRESLFKSYTIINRLLNLSEGGELNIRPETFKRLTQKLLSSAQIPFHGEPAIGMQIMGVLETRNLDFKNLIIMSVNEGLLPQTGGTSSFIPYNIRKAFGMSTIEHLDALYGYYFYRLVQRAENITFMYNTSSDGLNKGEWSRFLLQFLIEWPHTIDRKFLEAAQSPQKKHDICIHKTNDILSILYERYNAVKNPKAQFSPSALNTYLDCSLKFYFKYIADLKIRNEVNTDIDSAKFGSIFHRSVELAYKRLTQTSKQIRKEDLEKLLRSDAEIQHYVDLAFKELFFQIAPDERSEYNGIQLINSKVIASYVKQLLRNDMHYAPFEMIGMEKRVSEIIDIKTGSTVTPIKIGGIIDRIDKKDDTLRIVDYKTGGSPKIPVNIEQLFIPAEGRPSYILQTFLYAAILCRKQPLKVAPALLYIHRASSDEYSPVVEMGEARKPKMPVNNFSFFEDEFRERLCSLLEEIYDPSVSFTTTQITRVCEYCDYKTLCKK